MSTPSYRPDGHVVSVHAFPHVDRTFAQQTNSFIRIRDERYEYIESISINPIVFVLVGTGCVLLYWSSLCCSKCRMRQSTCGFSMFCKQTPCLRNAIGAHGTSDGPWSAATVHRIFACSLFLAVVSSSLIFVCSDQIRDAKNNFEIALEQAALIFETIHNASSAITAAGTELNDVLTSSACNTIPPEIRDEVHDYVDGVIEEVNDVLPLLDSFPGFLRGIRDDIDNTDQARQHAAHLWFGIMLIVVAMFAASPWLQSRLWLSCQTLIVGLAVTVLTAYIGAASILMTFLADFCVKPASNLLFVIGAGGQLHDVLSYYLYCTDDSPFDANIAAARDLLEGARTYLEEFRRSPLATACYTYSSEQLTDMTYELDVIIDTTTCPPVYATFDVAVQRGLCGNGFDGLFISWAATFSMSFWLFVALVVSGSYFRVFQLSQVDVDVRERGRKSESAAGVDSWRHRDDPAPVVQLDCERATLELMTMEKSTESKDSYSEGHGVKDIDIE